MNVSNCTPNTHIFIRSQFEMADGYCITNGKRYHFLYDSLIFRFYGQQGEQKEEEEDEKKTATLKIWPTESVVWHMPKHNERTMRRKNIKCRKIRRHLHFNTSHSYLIVVYDPLRNVTSIRWH